MLQGVVLLVPRLTQVGVEPDAVLPGQDGALPQQSPLTEKGEQGARATCRMDPKDGSWYASMTRAESFMISSTV